MIIHKKISKQQLQICTFHQQIQTITCQKLYKIHPISTLPLGLALGIQQHFQKTESYGTSIQQG